MIKPTFKTLSEVDDVQDSTVIKTKKKEVINNKFEMPTQLISEERIKTLKRAIQANGNDPFAWYALGVCFYGKKSMMEALECFLKAETIKKGFSAANYYYIALVQRHLERIDDSNDFLRKAASMRAINAVDKKGRALAQKMLASVGIPRCE